MLLHIDHDRSVAVALAQGEIVHAEDADRADGGIWQSTDQPEHRVLAQPDGLHFGEAGAGSAAKCEGDRLADRAQQHRATAVAEGQVGYLLGEGPLLAAGVVAEEPAYLQVEHGLLVPDRGVWDLALIPAVHPRRVLPAPRTGRRNLSPRARIWTVRPRTRTNSTCRRAKCGNRAARRSATDTRHDHDSQRSTSRESRNSRQSQSRMTVDKCSTGPSMSPRTKAWLTTCRRCPCFLQAVTPLLMVRRASMRRRRKPAV